MPPKSSSNKQQQSTSSKPRRKSPPKNRSKSSAYSVSKGDGDGRLEKRTISTIVIERRFVAKRSIERYKILNPPKLFSPDNISNKAASTKRKAVSKKVASLTKGLPEEDKVSKWVYVVKTMKPGSSRKLFYTGYTVNLPRRILQHNGVLSGGAMYTSKAKNWKFFCFVSGIKDTKTALHCEWIMKKVKGFIPSRVKRQNLTDEKERIYGMSVLFARERFTSNSVPISSLQLTIHWCAKLYLNYAKTIEWPPNISHVLI